MQHSQLRSKNETVKLFAHKNPETVEKTLVVYDFNGTVANDITPTYSVQELNPGYFSTEIVTPNNDTYLLILFCGSPIVLRVGSPKLQFIFYSKKKNLIPYTHFNEFGEMLSYGELDKIIGDFYFYTPVNEDLGYVEVFKKPYILSTPYCDPSISVFVAIVWNKRVMKKKFGSITEKLHFFQLTKKEYFKEKTNKKGFKENTNKENFKLKVIKKRFYTKPC